jgi:hypothetical protein
MPPRCTHSTRSSENRNGRHRCAARLLHVSDCRVIRALPDQLVILLVLDTCLKVERILNSLIITNWMGL